MAAPTPPARRANITPARLVLAAALVIGAVLFLIGTRGESHATDANTQATTATTAAPTTTTQTSVATTETAPTATTRAPEGSPEREAQEHGATTPPTTTAAANTSPSSTAAANTSVPAITGAAEGTPEREAAESGTGHVETAAERSSEKILGVNPETGGIVAGVVVLSIALAILVLARRFRSALWVAGGFCALAAVADLHELRIQTDRSKTGLAVIAGTVAAVHVIGAIAGVIAGREPA